MDLDALVGHFRITRDAGGSTPAVPEGWQSAEIGAWSLHAHPSLKVIEVTDTRGARRGWLLGVLLDGEEWRLESTTTLGLGDDPAAAFETFLYRHGGRFVGILLCDGTKRLYVDPGATMSVVFDPESGAAGSGPAVLRPDDYHTTLDRDLLALLDIPNSSLWFPAGLTSHVGIERVLPNHYLDLDTMTTHRHWPCSPFEECNPPEMVDRIVSCVQASMQAIAAQRRIHQSLTAGRDSRMLLACARVLDELPVTFTFTEAEETLDAAVAWELTRRLGLRQLFLRSTLATPEQRELWLVRTGHALSGGILSIHQTLRHLDPARVVLPGHAGEVGRANYWHEGDSDAVLTPEELTARFGMPPDARLHAAVGKWIDGLPDLPWYDKLDLAHIEQRLGCWAGPAQYGSIPFNETVLPFAHRAVFTSMLSFPPRYRRMEQLPIDICRQAWPETTGVRFNTFPGARGYTVKARAALRDPERILIPLRIRARRLRYRLTRKAGSRP
ncbi:MAG: hypothetical protein IT198_05780 [Acidimicrobiia bacterium]|nr:hypothetical protein [Acidimicrobiia bacterium]